MAWWFGRKSAPEPVRALVPAWLGATGGGEGFARSYDAQFDEVYRNNPVGQRAVRLVSGLLGSLTIYSADGDPSTGSGQAEAAAKLVSPELIEAIGAALLLNGNAYVQLLTDADEKPHELVMLRPERVSVETDQRGWPVAYAYRAGGKAARFARADGLGRALVAHRVRQLQGRLCDRRAQRDDDPSRPVHAQTLRPLLRNSASGPRRRGSRGRASAERSAAGAGRGVLLSCRRHSVRRLAAISGAPRGLHQRRLAFCGAGRRLEVFVKSTQTKASYRSGAWDVGTLSASRLVVEGTQVVGPQAQAIADAAGGATVDAEARATVSAILAALRQHGLISA